MSQKPEIFGKYVLLEKIAQGGMAEIFLARAPGAGGISKFVAIKRILPQYSDNQDFIRMFKDEAKIVVNLSHSNIVSVNEFGVVDNLFFLVMDFVTGRNLRQILNKMNKKDTHFSVEQIVYIVNEVAAGLDHAHRCLDEVTGKPLNITHRDMSPQNVMISFEGEVKIVDFGIAKAESQIENTRAGTLKGKFGYMSPEQAEGQTVDLRTDIFSLGIVLWEMLANERLFIANNEINTLRKIRDCNVPSLKKFNPNMHPELERIVLKSLARDRNMRYQTGAAMHRDLNRFLNRHYPDFSPQDFAVTIKTLFADEILQSRKRMMEYAKLPIANTPVEEDSIKRAMVGNYKSDEDDSFDNLTRPSAKDNGELHPQIKINLDQKAEKGTLDFSKLQASLENQVGPAPKNPTPINSEDDSEGPTQIRPKLNIKIDESLIPKASSPNEETPDVEDLPQKELVGSGVSVMNSRYTSTQLPPEKEPSAFKPLFLAAFVMVFLAAGLVILEDTDLGVFGQSKKMSSSAPGGKNAPQQGITSVDGLTVAGKKANSTLKLPPSVDCKKIAKGTEAYRLICANATPEEKVGITIQSVPSGAKIFIDKKDTGMTTPSTVMVPRNRPFDILLQKRDFIEYNKIGTKFSELTSRKVVGVLQEAQVGFLSIDVMPPQNVKVYVNGKSLEGERLPIKKYAIPAGRNVIVEAYNPISRSRARKTVNLKNKENQFIIMRLSNKHRRPSSRK